MRNDTVHSRVYSSSTNYIPTQHSPIGLYSEQGPCSLWGRILYIKFRWSSVVTAVACLRQSVAGLSLRRRAIGPRPVHVKFVVDEVAMGEGVLRVFSVSPFQYNSTSTPYASSYAWCSYQKDKLARPGNRPKSNTLSEIGGHWILQYFRFIVFTLGTSVVPCQHQSTNPPYTSSCSKEH